MNKSQIINNLDFIFVLLEALYGSISHEKKNFGPFFEKFYVSLN